MSLFNAFVTADRALVGFDTEAVEPGGNYTERNKAIFLPTISAVVGFRGLDMLFACAMPAVTCFSGSFDDLVEIMPEIVRGAQRTLRHNAGSIEVNPDENYDFLLVGFSPALERMVGHSFSSTGESHDCPQFVAPGFGVEWLRSLGIQADRDGMIALALDQCARVRAENSLWPADGRLFIAAIRKGSTTIDEVCSFPTRGALK